MIRPLLTWDTATKRWIKRFKLPGAEKHRTFAISAKQLSETTGCQPTMAEELSEVRESAVQALELDLPQAGQFGSTRAAVDEYTAARLIDVRSGILSDTNVARMIIVMI